MIQFLAMIQLILSAGLLISGQAFGETMAVSSETARRYSIHFQATVIDQGHARFYAPYSGPNSLQPAAESATSAVRKRYRGFRAGG